MLKASWAHLVDELATLVGEIIPRSRVLILGTPPPKTDERIRTGLLRDSAFVELTTRRGLDPTTSPITPLQVRVALWDIVQEQLADIAASTGATFVPVPVCVFATDGSLRDEFAGEDVTHGNAKYGEMAWRAVADVLKDG